MKPGVSKCFEVSSDLAKVGDCQKFIKGPKRIIFTRVPGNMLSSSLPNLGSAVTGLF